jgi:hypothetical protein
MLAKIILVRSEPDKGRFAGMNDTNNDTAWASYPMFHG